MENVEIIVTPDYFPLFYYQAWGVFIWCILSETIYRVLSYPIMSLKQEDTKKRKSHYAKYISNIMSTIQSLGVIIASIYLLSENGIHYGKFHEDLRFHLILLVYPFFS